MIEKYMKHTVDTKYYSEIWNGIEIIEFIDLIESS